MYTHACMNTSAQKVKSQRCLALNIAFENYIRSHVSFVKKQIFFLTVVLESCFISIFK